MIIIWEKCKDKKKEKNEKSEKQHTSTKRSKICLYQRKINDLCVEVNTAIQEAIAGLWEINNLGTWKWSENIPKLKVMKLLLS